MNAKQTSQRASEVAPLRFRLLAGLAGTALAAPVILVTGLALAWRATEPSWLLPVLLCGESALVIASLTFARRPRRRLFAAFHRRTRHPALRVGVPVLVLALLGLGWRSCHRSLPRSTVPAERKSVAVVGGGAAGVHAAWMLHQAGMDFTVYEAEDRLGGHAYAVPFETDNGEIFPVDVGFIFGAPRGYEEMKALMAYYEVPRTQSRLTYSSRAHGKSWATEAPDSLDPEALRFHELADAHAADSSLDLVPFGWWLRWHGFDDDFRREYLTPILVVLFITDQGIYDYSTRFVLAMVHGETKWVDFREGGVGWIVGGGSNAYYAKLTAPMAARIRLSTPVTRIERIGGRIKLRAVGPDGKPIETWYDEVILAVPADVARVLVVDRTPWEDWVLGQVRYEDSKVVLHTDESALPADPALRRNYNYLQLDEFGDEFELSGMMGRTLGGGRELSPEPIGTLNPQRPLDDVRFERVWRHHAQDLWHLAVTGELLPGIQGNGGVYYAGDWVQYIGHGPALRSGMKAACRAGAVKLREPGPEDRCVEAVIQDPMPWVGASPKAETLCGEAGVYRYALEKACKSHLARALAAEPAAR